MQVRDILKVRKSAVAAVSPEETVATAARRIADKGKGLAVICDQGKVLLGIISVIDINRAVALHREYAPALLARELMNTVIVVCKPDDTVEEALDKMACHGVRHLPVVENGALLGVVNIRHLLESRFERAQLTAAEMHRYIYGLGYR